MKNRTVSVDQFVAALSDIFRSRRIELGISQQELAEKTELHRTYVSMIERESCNFSMKAFFRLTEALELNPPDVMLEAKKLSRSNRRSR